jgi:NitT/TauT family transport system permease protein
MTGAVVTTSSVPARRTGPSRWRRPGRALAWLAGRILPPLVVLIALIGAWYWASTQLLSPTRQFLLPPPDAVVRVGFLNPENRAELLAALGLTAGVAGIGLTIAVAVGLLWAAVMSQSRFLDRALYPYAVVLQTIPILAVVPLIGFGFGYSYSSRVLVCVLISLFPVVANAYFGLRSVDQGHHDLFTLYRAGRFTRLWKLQFPAALPSIFTGLRIAAGASVIGAVVGDFFFQQGDPGLGQLIPIYLRNIQTELSYAAVALACLFGLVVFTFFGGLARWVASWHESVRHRPTT